MTSAGDAAGRWAVTWQRCWESGEVEPIVELYAADAEGLVAEQHDTWHMGPGRRDPPADWGG